VNLIHQIVLQHSLAHFISICNNMTENGLLLQIAHRLYQSILYFQNVTEFHGTRINVISLTLKRKVQPSFANFHKTHKSYTMLCANLLYQFLHKSDNNSTKYGLKFNYALTAPIFKNLTTTQ